MCKQYVSEDSDGYFVNDDGKKEVERIVAEIDNTQISAGDPYWDKSPASAIQRYRIPEKDKEQLHSWAKEEIDLGKIDILVIQTGRDYALLAYWLLITYLKKRESFRWNEAYEYLTARTKAISVSGETFSKTVKSPKNADLFRESGEAYFLTPEANAKVQEWIDGISKPVSSNAKAK